MANNEIRTGKKTNGEFTVSYQSNGYGGAIPVIDGVPHQELMFGYVSEDDRKAGLDLLTEALKATNGDIPSAMRYMYNAVMTSASGIKADEAVQVDGEEIIINYAEKKAYLGTEEIGSLGDCELPEEIIKSALVEIAKGVIQERAEMEYEDEDYEDDWEEDDWEYHI